jgi:hypothetical protein
MIVAPPKVISFAIPAETGKAVADDRCRASSHATESNAPQSRTRYQLRR